MFGHRLGDVWCSTPIYTDGFCLPVLSKESTGTVEVDQNGQAIDLGTLKEKTLYHVDSM